MAKGLGTGVLVIIFVICFCLIAIFSKYEPADQSDRNVMIRYEHHDLEFQLLKRAGERYAVYGIIDQPYDVKRVQHILKQANWQAAKVQMEREPDFKIETVRAEEPLTL
ncbi:hypothetical protein [Paenibacillus xylaniclasticus]|uniref:hypothetical protein n=1 Tax=Paenibacillus xylaniclasticus TaxID=588083 RepID=UPI000FD8FBBA|nr:MULTISPECIES: hypothetical protein [Paenibacillus]GFN30485.1 hypothetical protein PCURB6_07450 [Paenibacillus curdlanolyticus]